MVPVVFLPYIKELLRWTGEGGFEARIRGKAPAVDAYVWLHELVYSYAEENYRGNYEPLVAAFLGRITKLHRYGAIPFVVFDGEELKGKKANATRGARRNSALKQLNEEYIAAVARGEDEGAIVAQFDENVLHAANAIKPELVHAVISELRDSGVRYVVAPYEADAQIAQLWKEGLVDSCLTNDADLIIYGLPLVFFCTSRTWVNGACRYYSALELERAAEPKARLVRIAKKHGATATFRL